MTIHPVLGGVGTIGFGDENLPQITVRYEAWLVEVICEFNGSGTFTFELSPDGAEDLAKMLMQGAEKAREEQKRWDELHGRK